MMVAGGAEELCASEAAVFDTLFATSTRNETPKTTPRPFDRDRDGLVIGEGACTLVLEDLEHAIARGARIHAEIVGFGSNADGDHLTHPNTHTMQRAMRAGARRRGRSCRRPSATSMLTRQRPSRETSPRLRPLRGCSARACP